MKSIIEEFASAFHNLKLHLDEMPPLLPKTLTEDEFLWGSKNGRNEFEERVNDFLL